MRWRTASWSARPFRTSSATCTSGALARLQRLSRAHSRAVPDAQGPRGPSDVGAAQTKPISSTPISRIIWASRWSRATTWRCATGKVFLKTLMGLERVAAIFRRVDSDYCDPLECRGDSAIGVPGLVDAVRAGSVVLANALGGGVMESPAMDAYLPGLSRALLGEDLKMPDIPTVVAAPNGAARKHCRGSNASSCAMPSTRGRCSRASRAPGSAPRLSLSDIDLLKDRIRRRGATIVTQDAVPLGLAPVFEDGKFGTKPVNPARLRRLDAAGLYRDAGRPGARGAGRSCPLALHPVRRGEQGCLGMRPRAGRTRSACSRTTAPAIEIRPHRRGAAEPRDGQPVLAGTLHRARRAHGARLAGRNRAAGRGRRSRGRHR